MSVQKRKRERDKAERAALKREERLQPREEGEASAESSVATQDDLEGYGIAPMPDDEDEEAS